MQLQRLTMQNFGPYRDEEVDFTAFATNAVFLISGKTGSGKTTIFDALVYSLYGTTTGGERSGTEMRANFATPKEPTVVTLRFTHGGREYVITRAPEQLLAKKRGSGLTKVPAKVSLKIMQDGQEEDELTKVQTVRDRIQALLQLDADQFRQMVLLPQGKFRQFLDANSDAKGALLRHLFNTTLYARWQTALQTAAKKQSAAIEKQQAHLAALAAQFDYGEQAPKPHATIAEQLSAMATVLTTLSAAAKQAQAAAADAQATANSATAAYQAGHNLAAAYDRRQQAQSHLDELNAAAPALQEAARRLAHLQWAHELAPQAAQRTRDAQAHRQLQVRHQATTAAYQQAATALAAATAEQQRLQAQAPAMAAAQERLRDLTHLQTQLELVAADRTAQRTAAERAEAAAQALQTAQAAVAADTAALAAKQQEQERLAAADQSATLQRQEQLAERFAALEKRWTQTQHRLVQGRQAAAVAAERVEQAQGQAEAAQADYRTLHDRRLNNQIAALVAQLSPGAACPVCGSTQHPHPAAVAAQAEVADETLQAAEAARTQATEALAAAQAQQAQLQQAQAQQQADVAAAAAEIQTLAGAAAQADAAATLAAHATQLAALRKTVAAQTAAQRALQTAVAALSEAQAKHTGAVQTATAAAQQAQVAEAVAAAKLAADAASLPEAAPALADLQAEQARLTQQVTAYAQAQDANQQQAQAARDQHTRLQTTLADEDAQLTAQATALEAVDAQLAAALAAHDHTDEAQFTAWLQAQDEIPTLQQQLADAREATARQTALLEEAVRQIAERPQPDVAALAAQQAAAGEAVGAAQQAAAVAQQQLVAAKRLHTQLDQGFKANQAALTESMAMQNLAAVVNGSNAQKLSLERYVLRAYLQQVLVVANKRLEGLSDGRYQLLLHQDPGSYRNDSGLEIDVYDDQVGETRSVHTLSGGESFIAALALALALGEVIQQTAGGITIDALFIDEGFGSLDSASLDTALAALETIEGQARMIGIISHVESLQTGIPDQLRVQPTGAGDSHITVMHLGE